MSLHKLKITNSFNDFSLVIQRNGTGATCSGEEVLEFFKQCQLIDKRGDFFLSEKAGGPPSEPTIWGFVVCFVWFVCLSRVYY